MHSLSGLEASQIPEAMMGIEHMSARKLRNAVILLLTAMIMAGDELASKQLRGFELVGF